jgi:hypothetical protein
MNDEPSRKRLKTVAIVATAGRPSLPEDILVQSILPYLDVEALVGLRPVSKRVKAGVEEATIGWLATSAAHTRPKPLHALYMNFFRHFGQFRVTVREAWQEDLHDWDSVLAAALDCYTGILPEYYADILREQGQYAGTEIDDDEDGVMLEWSRKVEFVEDLPLALAMAKLHTLFEDLERRHKHKYNPRLSLYVYDRTDADWQGERDKKAARIRQAKHVCFAIFLTNKNTTVTNTHRSV